MRIKQNDTFEFSLDELQCFIDKFYKSIKDFQICLNSDSNELENGTASFVLDLFYYYSIFIAPDEEVDFDNEIIYAVLDENSFDQ